MRLLTKEEKIIITSNFNTVNLRNLPKILDALDLNSIDDYLTGPFVKQKNSSATSSLLYYLLRQKDGLEILADLFQRYAEEGRFPTKLLCSPIYGTDGKQHALHILIANIDAKVTVRDQCLFLCKMYELFKEFPTEVKTAINARDLNLATPLHRLSHLQRGEYISQRSVQELISVFLMLGADLDAKDKKNKTPADYANKNKRGIGPERFKNEVEIQLESLLQSGVLSGTTAKSIEEKIAMPGLECYQVTAVILACIEMAEVFSGSYKQSQELVTSFIQNGGIDWDGRFLFLNRYSWGDYRNCLDMIKEIADRIVLPEILLATGMTQKDDFLIEHCQYNNLTSHCLNVACRAIFKGLSVESLLALSEQWHKPHTALPIQLRPVDSLVKKKWHALFEPFRASNGITVLCLISEPDLETESKFLGHCIGRGSYATECCSITSPAITHIVSLRRSDEEGGLTPLFTLQYHLKSATDKSGEIKIKDKDYCLKKVQGEGKRGIRNMDAAQSLAYNEWKRACEIGKVKFHLSDFSLTSRVKQLGPVIINQSGEQIQLLPPIFTHTGYAPTREAIDTVLLIERIRSLLN